MNSEELSILFGGCYHLFKLLRIHRNGLFGNNIFSGGHCGYRNLLVHIVRCCDRDKVYPLVGEQLLS